MNKFKLFVENFLVYGLGGIFGKVVPLIMVPIVAHIMPNSTYFGISDLSNTIVSFASALAVMGMYDAMYRMFFDKEEERYKIAVCSTALTFTLCTSLVVFILMLLGRKVIAQFFLGDNQYAYLVYITAIATLVGATNNIISAPTRMQNKRKVFLVTSIISPLLSYSISIPLLLKGFYTVALPLAAVVSGLSIEIVFGVLNKNWFDFKKCDTKLLKQLLMIAIPLFPNFLIYWIFNSSDKIMITNMLNVGEAGIYSVGAKLGHASQLIYTAFAGGWQYFAFATMKEENQVKSNSLVFEYLGIISFAVTTFICAWSYLIFQILFPAEYLSGYIVAPYLFLAPLLQMLFQIACNQFIIIKKTWPNMLILAGGAIINIIINFVLIPVIGIEGAALATLMGYIISDIVCVGVLEKMKLMEINRRFIGATIIMIMYVIVWRIFFSDSTITGTIIATITSGVFVVLYREDIGEFFSMIKNETSLR